MIRYLNPLYVTDKTSDQVKKIKNGIRTGTGMIGYFLITIATGEHDVLDILPVALFKQRSFRHRDYDVIGLAENEQAAFLLVKRIHEEYYDAFHTYSGIKTELLRRLGEQEKKN